MAGDNIHRSPNGRRWVARWRTPDNRTRKKTFDTKAQAKAHLARMRVDVTERTYVDDARSKVLFMDFAEQWRQSPLRHHRPSTAAQVESYLTNHAYDTLGNYRLNRITGEILQNWVNDLEQTLAPSTVETVARHVRTILNSAVDERLLSATPWTSQVKLPERAKTEIQWLTSAQVHEIADTIPPRYRALVLFMAATGCRPAEAFGVTLDRLNLDEGAVTINRQLLTGRGGVAFGPLKTKAAARTVPFGQRTVGLLNEHLDAYGVGPDELVFTNGKTEPIRRNRFGEVWRTTMLKLTDIEARGPHQLRHFYASGLIRQGESMTTVQSRLGHSSITETSTTYAHLWEDSDETTRAASELIVWG